MASAKAFTVRRVEQLTSQRQGKIGWHKDGAERGLLLQITRLATLDKPAAASWVLRFTLKGTEYYHGLGSLQNFNLEEARNRARKARQQISDGVNPVETRKADKATAALAKARTITFQKASEEYYEANHQQWKSLVHRQQFQNTMRDYAMPVLGKLAVADIDTALVIRCLEPIWHSKTETASRVRQRIEAVIAWSIVRGYRTGDNPARWKGHLDKALPQPTKVAKVQHHPSLDYREMPGFMRDLRQREGFAAAALQLTILCATRTTETIGARWPEFDLDDGVWTIPKERMKGKRAHTVPLSDRAVALLRSLPREGEFVFPGMRAHQPISNMAMSAVLSRMGRDDVTTHGMRATFRTWASDRTNYPEHVIEASLAHVVSDAVVAAYKRSTMIERRAKLMQAWSDYCSTPPAKSTSTVVALRG